MLHMHTRKAGQWETVKSKADEKKNRADAKKKAVEPARDRLGIAVDPLTAFDRSFAAKEEAAKAAAAKSYKGAFADLEDEAPPQQLQEDVDSGDDEPAASSTTTSTTQKKQKQPKAPKKPKLSVAQVAAGLDVASLQSWMAEVQQRYSANETAQLEALAGRLESSFKEATLDLGKIISTKGLEVASQQPAADLPNSLMNALASFVASVSEPALVQVLVPLVNAVVTEASGAAGGQGPAGKGKAGLFVMVAVVLRTRPQALVQAAAELRMAGRQLSGAGKLPALLWVISQAAQADAAVGVAVWVRLLLPQLLGLLELPSTNGSSKGTKAVAVGDQAQLLVPLDVPSQRTALEYLADLLETLGVGAGGAASAGGDITRGDGALEPTVPGAAVELLSRLIAGTAWANTPSSAGAAGESKKAAAARSAAAEGLAPLLPGLTALAAVSSCGRHYSEWLVLALESAGLSSAAPEAPDQLVLRSASNVVACLCGNASCFGLWETKHKGSLRGSARVLAALVQQPQLMSPLLSQRTSVEGFRGLLGALPARHRSHLATGKGWQGSCARVAEDACNKLPRKLGRVGWGSKGKGGSRGGVSPIMAVLGLGSVAAGVLVMGGLYRREVAGIVAAYAGEDVAQQLEQQLLVPLEAGVQEGLKIAEPYLQQLQEVAGPSVTAAWEKVGPIVEQAQEQVVGPAVVAAQQLYATAVQQLQEIAAKAKQA